MVRITEDRFTVVPNLDEFPKDISDPKKYILVVPQIYPWTLKTSKVIHALIVGIPIVSYDWLEN